MRSELLHEALRTLQNRYLLCQIAAKATRKFHKPHTRVQETMNTVLKTLRRKVSQPVEDVGGYRQVNSLGAERRRRAACQAARQRDGATK